MKKLFFIIWSIVFIFAVFVVLGTANKKLGRKWIHHYSDEFSQGNLYQASMLDDFKEKLKDDNLQFDTKLGDASIIAFGDSFLVVDFGSPAFDVELQKKLKAPVFRKVDFAAYDRPIVDFNPLNFLRSVHYVKGDRKYMIVETVERFSIRNAGSYQENPQESEQKGLFERVLEGVAWRMSAFDTWARQNIIFLNNYNYPLQYFRCCR